MVTSTPTADHTTGGATETEAEDLVALPPVEQRRKAQEMARAEPDLTAAELAARFGKSDRWARTQRSAALHPTPAGTERRNGNGTSRQPEHATPENGTHHSVPSGKPEPATEHPPPADHRSGTPAATAAGTPLVPERHPAFRPDHRTVPPEPADRGHQSPTPPSQSAPEAARTAPTAAAPAAATVDGPGTPEGHTAPPTTKPVPPDGAHRANGTTGLPERPEPATTAGTVNPERNGTPQTGDPFLLSALILLAMAAAMAWSWQHLAHLAVMAGATHGEADIGPGMQWLLPVSVDVLLVAGAWKARRLHSAGRRPGGATWTALTASALMSLGGNVLSTLDMAGLTPPIDQWDPFFAVAVVVTVGLWMPAAAIVALEVLRDQGRAATETRHTFAPTTEGARHD